MFTGCIAFNALARHAQSASLTFCSVRWTLHLWQVASQGQMPGSQGISGAWKDKFSATFEKRRSAIVEFVGRVAHNHSLGIVPPSPVALAHHGGPPDRARGLAVAYESEAHFPFPFTRRRGCLAGVGSQAVHNHRGRRAGGT